MFNNNERDNMNNEKLADAKMSSGYTLQEEMLLQALERQAQTGRLMTNPHYTGFTSFAKAVRHYFNLDNDKKAPSQCKALYKYLLNKGYYDKLDVRTK
jgi:hypothetical protein